MPSLYHNSSHLNVVPAFTDLTVTVILPFPSRSQQDLHLFAWNYTLIFNSSMRTQCTTLQNKLFIYPQNIRYIPGNINYICYYKKFSFNYYHLQLLAFDRSCSFNINIARVLFYIITEARLRVESHKFLSDEERNLKFWHGLGWITLCFAT